MSHLLTTQLEAACFVTPGALAREIGQFPQEVREICRRPSTLTSRTCASPCAWFANTPCGSDVESLIVLTSRFRIRQDLVCSLNLSEVFLAGVVARVRIRVVPTDQFSVRLTDVVLGGFSWHP